MAEKSRIVEIIRKHEVDLLSDWVKAQMAAITLRPDLMSREELTAQSREFLGLFRKAVQAGVLTDISGPDWADSRRFLEKLSVSRAGQGFSPTETATFVFSLKQPIFTRLQGELADDAGALADEIWTTNVIVDKLGLFAMEAFIKGRQDIIARQQREMIELSTPVVKVWDGILAIPLIGTLDSARTQVVTESLLDAIVETGCDVAIIDITGVPTVDTLVAQHLIKTVSAARLMGAECVISGVRPAIAQAIVHLGVDLSIVSTKASLAEALRLAFKIRGLAVTGTKA